MRHPDPHHDAASITAGDDAGRRDAPGSRSLRGALWLIGAPMVAWGVPAAAMTSDTSEERSYCASRPGLGTTPCTIAPGRVSLEIGLADWERDDNQDVHSDTVLVGETTARFGVTDDSEVSVQWTPFGETWVATGGIPTQRGRGMGDLTVSAKVNLRNPDGSGLSVAVAPFLSVPVGRSEMGSDHASAGIVVPVSYAVGGPFSLQATSQLTLDPGNRGERPHLSAFVVGGIGIMVSNSVSLTQEIAFADNYEGRQRSTQSFSATSIAYSTGHRFQFDVGTVLGLNDNSPDARFYIGVSHQF